MARAEAAQTPGTGMQLAGGSEGTCGRVRQQSGMGKQGGA